MTILQKVFLKYGVSVKEAAKKGIPYCSVWQQWKGRRPVGSQAAVRYEKLLGIPRWELRPDLWDPPAGAQAEENGAEAQA